MIWSEQGILDQSLDDQSNKNKFQTCFLLGAIGFLVGLFGPWKKFSTNSFRLSWPTFNYKLVLVLPQNHLKTLNRAQWAAYCCSASILANQTCRQQKPWHYGMWTLTGQRKVVLKTETDSDFLSLCNMANKQKICSSIMLNESLSKKRMVLAVGPGPENILNQITGHLKLY